MERRHMRIKRDKYLDDLKLRMGNGMIKVITGIRRYGKTYLLFELFSAYLRSLGVDEAHLIEIALDDDQFEALRDPRALSHHIRERVASSAMNGTNGAISLATPVRTS